MKQFAGLVFWRLRHRQMDVGEEVWPRQAPMVLESLKRCWIAHFQLERLVCKAFEKTPLVEETLFDNLSRNIFRKEVISPLIDLLYDFENSRKINQTIS